MLDELTTEVADAAAGDEVALAALYHASIEDLTSFVRRRGVDDPEGTAHAAFERTVRKLPEFETATVPVFRAYLYRTARNLIIDEGRRHSVRPKLVLGSGARLARQPAAEQPIDAAVADDGLVADLDDDF